MALALADIVAVQTTPEVFTNTADRVFNLPTAGVSEGDMMVLCLVINQASADIGDVLTDPTGWTEAHTTGLPNTASTPRMYTYWRAVPGGGLGSTVTIVSSVTNISHGAVAFAVTNCDTDALDVVGTASTGTSTTLSCPAVTATDTGGLTIRFGANDDDDQSTQPSMSGHTAQGFEQVGNTVQNGFNCYVWAALQPSTSVAAATASISNEQWGGQTFVIAEGVAGISITDVETDEEFNDKDTAVTITGTVFEAVKGTGKVELASESNYAAATKILQTTTSWADTSIDFTADLSTLTPGALFLFVTNDSAERSAGFAVTVHRAVAFVMSASANIAASGENTTAQLTAPSGKTTADFDAGRIQDDENPADAVNVTEDDYTEYEWSIEATTNAIDAAVYQFRMVLSDGTVLDTYTVDPRWTIGSAAVSGLVEGGIELAGEAAGRKDALAIAAGGVKLGGTAAFSKTGQAVAVGQVELAGTAIGTKSISYAASGQIELGGVARGQKDALGVAVGYLELGGSARGLRTTSGLAVGGIEFAETAFGSKTALAIALGGLEFGGESIGTKATSGAAADGLELAGTAIGRKDASGVAVGSIELGGTAVGEQIIPATGVGQDGIELAGTAIGRKDAIGTAVGGIELGGTVAGEQVIPATGVGQDGLELAGTAIGRKDAIGIAADGIELAGIAAFAKTALAVSVDGIELGEQATGLKEALGVAVDALELGGTAEGRTGTVALVFHSVSLIGRFDIDSSITGRSDVDVALVGRFDIIARLTGRFDTTARLIGRFDIDASVTGRRRAA